MVSITGNYNDLIRVKLPSGRVYVAKIVEVYKVQKWKYAVTIMRNETDWLPKTIISYDRVVKNYGSISLEDFINQYPEYIL